MFTASFTAVYDACVLYPAPLRDLLMELASYRLFKAKWSEAIHNEWTRNLLANQEHLKPERIQATREAMNQAVPDCLVTGHEGLIDSLNLPDPKDRHVLAAAIASNADVIVTFNLKDFPEGVLQLHQVEAQHPDEFIRHLIDLHPDEVCRAAKKIRTRLKNPPYSADDYLMSLAKQKLPQTIEYLAERKDLI
ncbi:PIN domain-containing protein [Coraliomargarita sinensis]|uniref:PIN domain-containing protein n=1 Tax=Coraliomargarita sinensis TaxID=2174842 RepID=A0A317ZI67_9BACT|nr:PIN domain-containing protein [Coraliomargarita sinensis]PXA03987.1 PIN domain-containing protein [Coraliomargarita sinensis]